MIKFIKVCISVCCCSSDKVIVFFLNVNYIFGLKKPSVSCGLTLGSSSFGVFSMEHVIA